MTVFDHLKLIDRDPRELARFRSALSGVDRGHVGECRIEHEADGSCCRWEPWSRTMASIVGAVKPPKPIVAVNVDHREEVQA